MFNHQVEEKTGPFFATTFLPPLKKLVATGLPCVDVKRIVKIPATWGAKVTGEQFEERVGDYFGRMSAGKPAKGAE